ncbi:hypothetical protein RYX36_010711, partial [Vicia faba]
IQQQQLLLSRNSLKKKDESPYRRNPVSEIESNSITTPHSTTNYVNNGIQSRSKKLNASRIALDKGVDVNCNNNKTS